MSDLLNFLCENVPQFHKSRLPALYSDFNPLRTTNPEGYAANISAWLQGLAAAARAGVMPSINQKTNLLSISINKELLNALENENGRPLGLGSVVREGMDNRQLIPRQEFMEVITSIYERSWTQWSWQNLTQCLKLLGILHNFSREDKVPTGEFVVLENLEAAAKKIKDKFSSCQERYERIFTRENFVENFELVFGCKFPLSESDVELFLRYLARDMALISYNSEMVKLRSPNETELITTEDTTIASLKKLIGELNYQIKTLTQKYTELCDSAKEAVSKKNRLAALAALKSRSLVNQTLEKRYETLAQLEAIFSRVQNASNQVELVRVMEASAKVLETLNEGVQASGGAEKIIDTLQDQMLLVDETSMQTKLELTADEEHYLDLELVELETIERKRMNKEANEQPAKNQTDLETKIKLDAMKDIDHEFQVAREKPLTDSKVERELVENTDLLKNLLLS